MAKRESPFNCDAKNCAQTKGEGNHWLLVCPVDFFRAVGVAILPWHDGLAELPQVKHACGMPHALTVQAQVFEDLNKPAPPAVTTEPKGNTHDHPSQT